MRKPILVCAALLCLSLSLQGQAVRKQLHPIQKDGKWGFINSEGRIAIDPQFSSAGSFSEGLAPVRVGSYQEGKDGYIDTSGRIVIRPQFDGAGNFSEKMAVITQRSKSGYIDNRGRVLIIPKFDEADPFSEGMALIKLGGKFGFINQTGKIVIEPQFVSAQSFHHGLARVMIYVNDELRTGYIDKSGRWIVPAKFTLGYDFSEGLAVIGIGGAAHRGEGRAVLYEGPIKYNFIDSNGTVISKQYFDGAGLNFSEGLLAVKVNGLWGYVNSTGDMVIAPQFDNAAEFSEGLAAVAINFRWGYINKTGKFVIAPGFLTAERFTSGLALVSTFHNSDGYINMRGEFVWKSS